jgi:hypothetical protein
MREGAHEGSFHALLHFSFLLPFFLSTDCPRENEGVGLVVFRTTQGFCGLDPLCRRVRATRFRLGGVAVDGFCQWRILDLNFNAEVTMTTLMDTLCKFARG